MSLAELTRNSFQSGISASKWLALCKLLIAKESDLPSSEDVQSALSNSVLSVLRFYPGDPDLQEYLKCAIQENVLSLATFVSTLLQAARSPDLHNPATLDMLCRIALDAHYSSGLSVPVGSIVPYGESAIVTLGTVQDALALLRTAHSLPISHFHQLTTSASELVILLLSCVSDMSQVSTAQAMVHFADANDLLQNFQLSPNVRQVLENFMLSLSLLIGDDAKAAREAQMMHSLQVALGKGDVLGPNSSTDTVTFGLVLNHVILHRARHFGSGSSAEMVSLFASCFQWSSWTPSVFYTQLFITALLALAQNQPPSALLWRDFILGRLPALLISFEQAIKDDSQVDADWRAALQTALTAVLQRDIVRQCDHVLSSAESDSPKSLLFPELLSRLVAAGLLDESAAENLGVPSIREWKSSELLAEAVGLDVEIEAYVDAKLTPEVPPYDDLYALVDRICKDPVSHSAFATVIQQRFFSLAAAFDVESLSRICKVLYMHGRALDVLSLHVKMDVLLSQTLSLVDRYDCETIGDPQTAVSHLGDIVLFSQHALAHFNMDTKIFSDGHKSVSPKFLQSTSDIFSPDSLTGQDELSFNAWFKTLFDSSSEGIEDTILRTSRPKTLLKMAASLFAAAIKARTEGKIDADVLNNGISFFTGPLLSWTLIGVVKSLLKEIHRKSCKAPIHLEVLQTLLLSGACPKPVLVVCGSQIMTVLTSKTAKKLPPASFNITNIKIVVSQAIGAVEMGHIERKVSAGAHNSWQDHPRQVIHRALVMARSNKIPSIDVDRLVKTSTPTKLLQTLWNEISAAASLGEMENSRRIATFVLTNPPNPTSPPLVPIFLHIVLPSIILSVDALETTQQTPNVELLVILVSSVLTSALHGELALRGTQWENRSVLGEPIIAMAKRLATDLRSMKQSYTATAIVQRLASAQSFLSNFPVFKTF